MFFCYLVCIRLENDDLHCKFNHFFDRGEEYIAVRLSCGL